MTKKYDDKKVCFIICANDSFQLNECLLYLGLLEVPDGMEVQIMEIWDAVSMTAGYNEGMQSSDAKYKVYMHQDVRIVNRHFLYDMLSIFNHDKQIGLIGMVGSKRLPVDGIMWHGERVWADRLKLSEQQTDYYNVQEYGYDLVQAVDGYLMMTQYDISWQEEIFDGWDFYDISQSFEFKKAGYLIAVPKTQGRSWAVHEEVYCLNMWNYYKYRKIFADYYLEENTKLGE